MPSTLISVNITVWFYRARILGVSRLGFVAAVIRDGNTGGGRKGEWGGVRGEIKDQILNISF